jgi:orotate phosphoribosyltransferase
MMTIENFKTTSEKIAYYLLQIEAVKFYKNEAFKWASGWNSPIYCDNRIALSFPEVRTLVKHAIIETIHSNFSGAQAIAGVATAGIPQATLVADTLQLPLIYVRPKPKDHGMQNLIEGLVVPNQKVVVIEDLISTGGSSIKASQALTEAGLEVLGMVSIFNYGFEIANQNFSNAALKLISLSNYDTLVKVGIQTGHLQESQLESLTQWRLAPEKWKN